MKTACYGATTPATQAHAACYDAEYPPEARRTIAMASSFAIGSVARSVSAEANGAANDDFAANGASNRKSFARELKESGFAQSFL
jgi:hypothetical protein